MKRAMVRLVRGIIDKPYRLMFVAAGLLILGAAAVTLPTLIPQGLTAAVGGARAPEPRATGDFMRGNKELNADLVLNSLSDDARSNFTAGGGPGALAAQMQAAQARGSRVEDISYIGGRDLPDGTSLQFYVVGYRPAAGADVEYVPYQFTLDKSGKISRIQ